MRNSYIILSTILLMINKIKSSDYSPSCENSSQCHQMKTSAYYCNHFKSCVHFPMFLSPEANFVLDPQNTSNSMQVPEKSSNSIEESLETDKDLVLSYLGKTNKIRINKDLGLDLALWFSFPFSQMLVELEGGPC